MSLVVEGLVKRFGGLVALDFVSLTSQAGAVTAIIGPNGSGKSTLFDAITGVVPLDGGRVLLDGEVIDTRDTSRLAKRGIVRTFQVPRLARRMTVLENLMMAPPNGQAESIWRLFAPWYAARIRADEEARQDQAWQMARTLGLELVSNDLAGTLSGGQAKLLATGIALLADPTVLLLDEPTAGVNHVAIDRLLSVLSERSRAGRTTLLIEHNLAVVSELCSQVYVLHAGRILAQGSPDAVRRDALVKDAYLGRQVTVVR